MEIIAKIYTDFSEKFGIPRQSGLVPELVGKIVFEPSFRHPDFIRGIESFEYIWLIWGFSELKKDQWSALVRPPRLGGEQKMGVFATRSPFRPNHLGLSSVKLLSIDLETKEGPILYVGGADLKNETPIYDIKPYIAHVDAHSEAISGFSSAYKTYHLEVNCPDEILDKFPASKRNALLGVLSQDPRPAYQNDPNRIYGILFAGMNVRFFVKDRILQVIDVEKIE